MDHSTDSDSAASKRPKRTRSVRLSAEAVRSLEGLLELRRQADHPNEKLTRPLKAEILGVSVRTADRLLNGEPVDRSSIVFAFSRLGSEVDPSYILVDESSPDGEDSEIEDPTRLHLEECSTGKPDSDSGREQAVHRSNQSRRLYWALLALPVLTLVVFGAVNSVQTMGAVSAHRLKENIQETLIAAHSAFQKANYKEAERLFHDVIEKNKGARDIAYSADAKRGLAEIAIYRADYKTALSLIDQAIALRKEFDQESPHAVLAALRGEILQNLGDFKEAERCYRTAIGIYGRNKEPFGVALTQSSMGDLFTDQGRFEDAEEEIVSCLNFLRINHKDREVAATQLLLAKLRDRQGRPKEAIRVAKEALAYFEKEGHPRWLAKTNLILGQALGHANQRAEAKASLQHAQSLYQAVRDPRGLTLVSDALLRL